MCQEFAHAGADALSSTFSATIDPFKVSVPEEFGRTRDAHRGENGQLLIHIQDAHTNLSAQRNIASLIEELIRAHGIDTIFLEAGTKDASLNFLRPLADAPKRREVAERYLRSGKLTGAEYLNLSTDLPMSLIGVEEASLYEKNLRAYARVAKGREEAVSYLGEIGKRLDRLKNRFYPSAAMDLDRMIERSEKKDLAFTEYYERLSDAARMTGTNLLGYPHFLSLGELRTMEKAIDFEKAGAALREYAREFPELEELFSKEAVARVHSGPGSSYAPLDDLFERLRQKGRTEKDHPDLAAYRRYLAAYASVDLDELIAESKRVEKDVFMQLLSSDEARRIHEIDEALKTYQTLLSLQATREDHRAYLANKERVWSHLVGAVAFINHQLLEMGNDGDILTYQSAVDDLLPEVEDFYATTQRRDEVMVEKALGKMKEMNKSAAVLVTGGYHTLNLKELLRKRKASYVVVSPQVTNETDMRRYEKLLLSEISNEGGDAPRRASGLRAEHLGVRLALESRSAAAWVETVKGELAEEQTGARLSRMSRRTVMTKGLMALLSLKAQAGQIGREELDAFKIEARSYLNEYRSYGLSNGPKEEVRQARERAINGTLVRYPELLLPENIQSTGLSWGEVFLIMDHMGRKLSQFHIDIFRGRKTPEPAYFETIKKRFPDSPAALFVDELRILNFAATDELDDVEQAIPLLPRYIRALGQPGNSRDLQDVLSQRILYLISSLENIQGQKKISKPRNVELLRGYESQLNAEVPDSWLIPFVAVMRLQHEIAAAGSIRAARRGAVQEELRDRFERMVQLDDAGKLPQTGRAEFYFGKWEDWRLNFVRHAMSVHASLYTSGGDRARLRDAAGELYVFAKRQEREYYPNPSQNYHPPSSVLFLFAEALRQDAPAELIRLLKNEKTSWYVMDTVFDVFKKHYQSSEAVEYLMSIIEDPGAWSEFIRARAIETLGEMGATSVMPRLLELSRQTPSPEVREAGEQNLLRPAGVQEAARAALRAISLRGMRRINDLHERPDAERFAGLEEMEPWMLYSLMAYGNEEIIYTSTFTGLFTRLLQAMKRRGMSGEELLESVGYSNFRTFIRMTSTFNPSGRVAVRDFLDTMSASAGRELLSRFVSGLEQEKEPVRESVAIVDAFQALKDTEILTYLRTRLEGERVRTENSGDVRAKEIYAVLAEITAPGGYPMPDLERLSRGELFINGRNIQRHHFYDDEDGRGSFESFLDQYRTDGNWVIEPRVNEGYVAIRSRFGSPVEIYANYPDTNEKGQKAIDRLFETSRRTASIQVHRGHSYHVQKTLEYVRAESRLVFLGSCGGYSNLAELLGRSPKAQALTTKGVGTKQVNDPLLKMISEDLRGRGAIEWRSFWARAAGRLRRNPDFSNYIAPPDNKGAILISVMNARIRPSGARLAVAEADLVNGQNYHLSFWSADGSVVQGVMGIYRGSYFMKGHQLPDTLAFEVDGKRIEFGLKNGLPNRLTQIMRASVIAPEPRLLSAAMRSVRSIPEFLEVVRAMKTGDTVRLAFEEAQGGRAGSVNIQGKVLDRWVAGDQGGFKVQSGAALNYEFSTHNGRYRFERFENLGARLADERGDEKPSVISRWAIAAFIGGAAAGFIAWTHRLRTAERDRREAAERSLEPYRSGVLLGSKGQVRDRIASTETDVQDVLRVQAASAADPSTYLNEDVIRRLVKNGQVLAADIYDGEKWKMVGAVHINMSREGKVTKYRRILRPKNHVKSGDVLYDFWIVVDKNLNRWDEVSISDALIDATAKIAAESGKLVMAYSRPGDALDKLAPGVRQELINKHWGDEGYRAKLALRHFLSVRPVKNRKADGSVQPFLDWLKAEGIVDIAEGSSFSLDLRQVMNPDPGSRRKNPVRSPDFVKLVGLLYRQFLNDNPEFLPIDPALGSLHSRKGAHLHRIYFDSRPDDSLALGMNFIMSYEQIADLPAVINKLAAKRGYTTGARLASEYIEEVDPARERPVESGIVYAGRVANRRWYRENMRHTFAGGFSTWLKRVSEAGMRPDILDASAGTGAATLAAMERFTASGLGIGNAYAVDVSLKPEFNLFSRGAGILKMYEGGSIDRLRPYRLLWDAPNRTFGRVSDIPGIREGVDLAFLLNAVHLIRPKDQAGLFRQYFEALRPGGLLLIGSSGVDHPERKPEERLLDSLFETVRLEIPDAVERLNGDRMRQKVVDASQRESAMKARGAFILPAVMPDVIRENLEAAGFEKVTVRTDRTRLEADDFEPFLIEVPAYVRMYFSELYIEEDGSDLFTEEERKAILKEAYDRAFQKAGGSFTIWWTTIEALKPQGARLADAQSDPTLRDLVDIHRREFFNNPTQPEIQLGALTNLYELGKRAKGSDEDTLRAVTDLLTAIGRDLGRDARITQRAADYLLALSVKNDEAAGSVSLTVDAQALIQSIGQIMMRAVNGQTRVRVVYEKSLAPGLPGVRMESVGDFERYHLKGSRIVVKIDGQEETLYLHTAAASGQSKLIAISSVDPSSGTKGARLALPESLRLRRARARVDEMMKEPSIRSRNRLIDALSGESADFHRKIGMSEKEEALLAYLSSPEVNEIFGFIHREMREQPYEYYALYRPEDHSWVLQLRTRGWFSKRVVSWVSFRFNPSWTNPKILDAWTDRAMRGQYLYRDAVRAVIGDRFDRVWHVVKEANTLMDIYEQMPDGVKDASFAEKFKELITSRAKAREAGIPYELEQVTKSALHYQVWRSLRALRVGGGALSSEQISRTILGSVLGKMGFDVSLVATNRGSIWLLARRGGRVLDADEEITTSEARRWIEAFQERYPGAPLSGWVRDFINLFEDRLGELPPDDLILELGKALHDRTIGIWEADAFVAGLAPDSGGRTDFAEKFRRYMKEHDHIAAIQTGIEPDLGGHPLIKRTLSGVTAFWASEIVRHHSLSEEEVLSWRRELEEERRSLSQRLSAAEEADGSKYKGPSVDAIQIQGGLRDVLWKRIQAAAERYPEAAEDPYFVLRLAALGTSGSASALHNVAHHWIKEDRLGRYDLSDPAQKNEFMDHLFKEVLKNRFVLTDLAALGPWQRFLAQKEGRPGRISRVPVQYALTPSEKALLLELSGFWVSRSAGARLAGMSRTRWVADMKPDLYQAIMVERDNKKLQALVRSAGRSALAYFSFVGALGELLQTDELFRKKYELLKQSKFGGIKTGRLDPQRLFPSPGEAEAVVIDGHVFVDDVRRPSSADRDEAFMAARQILGLQSDILLETLSSELRSMTLARKVLGEFLSKRAPFDEVVRFLSRELKQKGLIGKLEKKLEAKAPHIRVIRFHRGSAQNVYVVMIPYHGKLISFALHVSRPVEGGREGIKRAFSMLLRHRNLDQLDRFIVKVYKPYEGRFRSKMEYFSYTSQYLDLHPALQFDGQRFYLKAVHLKERSATFLSGESTRRVAAAVAELLTTFYDVHQRRSIGDFNLGRRDLLVDRTMIARRGSRRMKAELAREGLDGFKLVSWREDGKSEGPIEYLDFLFGLSYLGPEAANIREKMSAPMFDELSRGILEGFVKGLERRAGKDENVPRLAAEWLLSYAAVQDQRSQRENALFSSERIERFVEEAIKPRMNDAGARLASDEQRAQEAYGIVAKLFSEDPLQVRAHFAGVRVQNWYDHGHDVTYILDNRGIFASMDVYLQNERKVRMNLSQLSLEVLTRLYASYDARMKNQATRSDEELRRELSGLSRHQRVNVRYQVALGQAVVQQDAVFHWFDAPSDQAGFMVNGRGPILLLNIGNQGSLRLLGVRSAGARLATVAITSDEVNAWLIEYSKMDLIDGKSFIMRELGKRLRPALQEIFIEHGLFEIVDAQMRKITLIFSLAAENSLDAYLQKKAEDPVFTEDLRLELSFHAVGDDDFEIRMASNGRSYERSWTTEDKRRMPGRVFGGTGNAHVLIRERSYEMGSVARTNARQQAPGDVEGSIFAWTARRSVLSALSQPSFRQARMGSGARLAEDVREIFDVNGRLIGATIPVREGLTLRAERVSKDQEYGSTVTMRLWDQTQRVDEVDEFSGIEMPGFQWMEPTPAYPRSETVVLTRLYLEPAYQNAGVGRAIMEWLARRASDKGYLFSHTGTVSPSAAHLVLDVLDPASVVIRPVGRDRFETPSREELIRLIDQGFRDGTKLPYELRIEGRPKTGARLSEIRRLAVLSEEARLEYVMVWLADHPKFNRTEFTAQDLVEDDDLKIYPINPARNPGMITFEGDGKLATLQSTLYLATARGWVTLVDGNYEITPDARRNFSSRTPEDMFPLLHRMVTPTTDISERAVPESLTDASFEIDPELGHYSPPVTTKGLDRSERANYVLWKAIQNEELRAGFRAKDLADVMSEGAWRIYYISKGGSKAMDADSMTSVATDVIHWARARSNGFLYEEARSTGKWYRFTDKARRYFAPDMPPEEIALKETAVVSADPAVAVKEDESVSSDRRTPILAVTEPFPTRSSVYEAFDDRKLLGWDFDEEELLRGEHPDENLHRAALRFGISLPKSRWIPDYSTIEGLNEELRRRVQKGLRIDTAALKSGYMSDPKLLAAAKRFERKLPSGSDYIEGEYVPPAPAKALTPASAFLNGRSPIEWLQEAPKEEIWEVFGPASTTAAIILRYREGAAFKTLSQWKDRVMGRSKGRVWTDTMNLVFKNIQKKLALPNDGPQKEKRVRPVSEEVRTILHDAWEARIQGTEITLDAYQAASGMDFVKASEHLRKLMRNGLLRNTEGYYNFTGKAVTMLADEGIDVKAPVGARLAAERSIKILERSQEILRQALTFRSKVSQKVWADSLVSDTRNIVIRDLDSGRPITNMAERRLIIRSVLAWALSEGDMERSLDVVEAGEAYAFTMKGELRYSGARLAEEMAHRLSRALNIKRLTTSVVVPLLIATKVTLFTFGIPNANAATLEVTEITDPAQRAGVSIYRGTIDLTEASAIRKAPQGSRLSDVSEKVADERMKWNAVTSAIPADLMSATHRVNIEIPTGFISGSRDTALFGAQAENALLSMAFIRRQAAGRNTFFYIPVDADLSDAQKAALTSLAQPYADFIILGQAPRAKSEGATVRLISTDKKTSLGPDGTIQLPGEPVAEDDLFGRAPLYLANAFGKILAADGSFDPALPVSAYRDELIEGFNALTADRASKENVRDITTGQAKWELFVKHRLLPAVRQIVDQIGVLANLKRQVSMAA